MIHQDNFSSTDRVAGNAEAKKNNFTSETDLCKSGQESLILTVY